MSISSQTLRQKSTAPGYLLKLANDYYCSRGALNYDGHDWQHLSFEVSGLATDGSASQSATVSILDRKRAWTEFLDNNGIDGLTLDLWQLYESAIAHKQIYQEGVNEEFEVDLPHVLGSDVSTDFININTFTGNTITDNGDGTNTIMWVESDTQALKFAVSDETIKNGLLTFNITSMSESITISRFFDGSNDHYINKPLLIGVNQLVVGARTGQGAIFLYPVSSVNQRSITIENTYDFKQITTPNSYLTYKDPATNKHVTIANQSDVSESSVELAKNGDFSNGLNNWVINLGATTGGSIVESGEEVVMAQGSNSVWLGLNQEIDVTNLNVLNLSVERTSVIYGQCRVGLTTNPDASNSSPTLGYLTFFATEIGTKSIDINVQNETIIYLVMVEGSSANGESIMDNASLKEFLPISTTYPLSVPSSNIFTTTVPLTDADRAYLDNNQEAVALLIEGKTVSELSFVLSEIYSWYLVNDKKNQTEAVFVGEVSQASSDAKSLVLKALGVRADYATTPRNRWISPFSNVSAGSAVQIGDETFRFEA